MSKITLTQLASLENENTAINQINGNSDTLVTSFDNTLSRDGTSPNQMGASLDMNSFQILNLPSPGTVNSPARLADVATNPTITVPPTGTSGGVVPFLNGNNTWSGSNTFSGTTSFSTAISLSSLANQVGRSVIGNSGSSTGAVTALTTPVLLGLTLLPTGGTNAGALNTVQTPAGIANVGTGLQQYNNIIQIGTSPSPDNVDCGSNTASSYSLGLYVQHVFGGTSCRGGREAIFGNLILVAPTATTLNGVRFYTGVSGQSQANVSDGGTIGAGGEKGKIYGANMLGVLANTATGFEQCSGSYDQVFVQTGASVKTKSINTLSYGATDAVQGSTYDAALIITAETGATAGGKVGILIGNVAGAQPLSTSGAIMSLTGTPTIATGIDLSGGTITTPFKSNGHSVNSTGAITSGGVSIGNGSLSLLGSTSGTATVSATSTGLLVFNGNANVDASGNIAAPSFTVSTVISTVPTTLTGTSGSTTSTTQIINASGSYTLTLPAASGSGGRWLFIKTIAAQTVTSATSNVVPLTTATPGTAILAGTAGKYVFLQSDGTNWITIMAN